MARRTVVLYNPNGADLDSEKNPFITDGGRGAAKVRSGAADRDQERYKRAYKTAWERVKRYAPNSKVVFLVITRFGKDRGKSVVVLTNKRGGTFECNRHFYNRHRNELMKLFGLGDWVRWEEKYGAKAARIERERWLHYGTSEGG